MPNALGTSIITFLWFCRWKETQNLFDEVGGLLIAFWSSRRLLGTTQRLHQTHHLWPSLSASVTRVTALTLRSKSKVYENLFPHRRDLIGLLHPIELMQECIQLLGGIERPRRVYEG